MKKIILIIVLGLLGIGAYFIYTSVLGEVLFQKEASYNQYSNGEKNVVFIGMHHIGRKEFYNDVKNKVFDFKSKGYVLFYEWIDFKAASDTSLRKLRRIIGAIPDYDLLSGQLGDDMMTQDNEIFLNQVNDKDFNIDYTVEGLVKVYESKYGEIKLDSTDFNIPIGEILKDSIANSHLDDIVYDARNKLIYEKIKNSEYDKILVVYGEAHEQGVYDLLKKENFKLSK